MSAVERIAAAALVRRRNVTVAAGLVAVLVVLFGATIVYLVFGR